MKKNYTLLSGLVLFSVATMAQNIQGTPQNLKMAELALTEAEDVAPLKQRSIQKAFGDTIYYEDFDQLSVANNWTIVDNSGNSTPWIWAAANTAPGGQYSTNVAALNSTSAANGYMLLPSDFYNTPTPGGGFQAMSTFFQSDPIDLRDSNNNPRGAVLARWQQSLRYCCSPVSELRIEASTDGVSWTSFDASGGQGGNTIWPNGQSNEVNLSCVLGGADTAYIRFRQGVATHYYWQIDDFALVEGPGNNVEMDFTEINFHPTYPLVPQYYEVPLPNLPATIFEGAVINGGGNVATNVDFNVDITGVSAIGGGVGTGVGLAYSGSAPVRTGTLQPRNPLTCDSTALFLDTGFVAAQFFSFTPNNYNFRFSTSSDSVNQAPAEAFEERLISLTWDSIVALERGEAFFQGTTGPGGYADRGAIGDALAGLVIIDKPVQAKGVRFWVSGARAASIAGISISPRIWSFDQSRVIQSDVVINPLDSGITGIAAQSPFSTFIDTCTSTCPPNQPSIMDTWIDLNFLAPVTLQPGTYYFGIEQTAGTNYIWTARDRGAEERDVLWTNIMFLSGGTSPGWGFGGFVSAIRLIADFPAIVNVDEQAAPKLDFEVYPNPNDGLFTINIANANGTTYMLNVRNMVGQTVMSEAVNVNGNLSKNMDLSSFEKGVYFVTLENGEDRLVRKVVVK
jgi:hypothetical protein